MRLPRTTGALSGLIVIVLGVWGALIPFIGPYFHYAFGSYDKWHFTTNRLWLDIVPGAVAVIGGWMLFTGSRRKSGVLGGWLAIAAGAWFAIGPAVSLWWHAAGNPIGAPVGGHIRQSLEWIGYFTGWAWQSSGSRPSRWDALCRDRVWLRSRSSPQVPWPARLRSIARGAVFSAVAVRPPRTRA